jgi:hypothetical protein
LTLWPLVVNHHLLNAELQLYFSFFSEHRERGLKLLSIKSFYT